MPNQVPIGQAFICVTCGSQFAPAAQPPSGCPICADPRQFVGLDGQRWTTLPELSSGHQNRIEAEEPGLYSIHTEPAFAIDERAFLLQTPKGNLLWDCVALLDQATIEAIQRLGGVAAIAVSHPHFYTTMVEWSLAFDNAPIHLHSDDRRWVMRPHPNIRFWSGERITPLDDLTLIHTPGHFEGFQVLHWPAGAGGLGALLSGDQPQVCMDRRWVSFMYSYPNFVPLDSGSIQQIVDTLNPYPFERIHGAFPRKTVVSNAKEILKRSAERYIQATKARPRDSEECE